MRQSSHQNFSAMLQRYGLKGITMGPRFLSMGVPLHNKASVFKFTPKLASQQIFPPNSSKSKLKSLKKKQKTLKRQIVRDINNLKQHKLKNVEYKVDPVLGNPNNGFVERFRQEVNDESNLAYGFKRQEVEKLFYGVEKATLSKTTNNLVLENAAQAEQQKRNAVLTILHLRNSNSHDKHKLALARARQEFARKEGDTGSPEVQAAILTVKIHFGMDHIKDAFKDKPSIQHVRQLVQQRQRILKYLKRTRPQDYFYCIEKLGLTDDTITREFNMGRQYLEDYNVWPGKQLVKLSDKQKRKADKFVELEKKIATYHQMAKKNFKVLHT